VRVRLQALKDWLASEAPDVLCLQETKVVDDDFPAAELAALGYRAIASGQKTYNGVAIVAREGLALELRADRLPGDPGDEQRRYLEARVGDVTVVNVYVPNGSEVGSEKYAYKMAWLARLERHLPGVGLDGPVAVCGDFNVTPEDRDVWDPARVRGTIMCSDAEREALRRIQALGLADTLRIATQDAGIYSFWDYRMGAFRRNMGWRIDLVLATPALASRCRGAGVDTWPRKMPQSSDHAPIYALFD
jgi:exodeoxyribonuclease-3